MHLHHLLIYSLLLTPRQPIVLPEEGAVRVTLFVSMEMMTVVGSIY